jgi:hypothetical protein
MSSQICLIVPSRKAPSVVASTTNVTCSMGTLFFLRFKEKGGKKKGERASRAPQVGGAPGRVPQSDRSRQRARLSCFLPLWAKPESFRAVRWCVPTPRTCSNDGSSKRGCRRTIHLTRSERPASQILWKTTAPWRPLALTHITKSFLKLEVFAAFANARSPLLYHNLPVLIESHYRFFQFGMRKQFRSALHLQSLGE